MRARCCRAHCDRVRLCFWAALRHRVRVSGGRRTGRRVDSGLPGVRQGRPRGRGDSICVGPYTGVVWAHIYGIGPPVYGRSLHSTRHAIREQSHNHLPRNTLRPTPPQSRTDDPAPKPACHFLPLSGSLFRPLLPLGLCGHNWWKSVARGQQIRRFEGGASRSIGRHRGTRRCVFWWPAAAAPPRPAGRHETLWLLGSLRGADEGAFLRWGRT